LGVRKSGDAVNIEMDVLAKHVAKLVEPHTAKRSWWRSLVGK
jgi:riboflavin synthase alpha subunit